MPRSLNGQDRGISLIEMVIAVLILSIGVAAGFQSLAQARKGIGEEVPRLIAREVAMNHAEALQLFGIGADLATQVTRGGITWTILAETAPTTGGYVEAKIAVRAKGQPGALITVYAPQEPPE